MKKKCKTCQNNCEGDFCFRHKPRKPLPKVGPLKQKFPEIDKKIKEINEMGVFFVSIWNKRPHRSEISNVYISGEPLSVYFHHILPKEKYPQAALDEENIIILTFEEHDNVELNSEKYEEINKRREKLKIKYNI